MTLIGKRIELGTTPWKQGKLPSRCLREGFRGPGAIHCSWDIGLQDPRADGNAPGDNRSAVGSVRASMSPRGHPVAFCKQDIHQQ